MSGAPEKGNALAVVAPPPMPRALRLFSRPLSAASSSTPLLERGLQLSLLGLHGKGERALQEGLLGFVEAPASPAKFEALITAGEASRLRGDNPRAVERLSLAAQAATDVPPGRLAYGELLLLEQLVAMGQTEDARRHFLSQLSRLDPASAELLNGYLQGVAGQHEEGLRHLQNALPQVPEGLPVGWAHLLIAEARMDLGKWTEADASLDEAGKEQRFGELFCRTLCARAMTALQRHAAPGAAVSLHEVNGRLRQALRYTVNFPRYALRAQLTQRLLRLLRSRDTVNDFLACAAQLSEKGFPFEEARLLMNAADALEVRGRERVVPLRAQGRELYSRLKLSGRLGAGRSPLEPGGGIGSLSASRSQATGRSLSLARSMSKSMAAGSIHLPAGLADEEGEVELLTLFETSRYLLSSPHWSEVLDRLLESVLKVLKAERGAFIEIKEGQLVCTAARGLDPARVRPDGDEISFSVLREAEQTGEVILSDNAGADSRFQAQASVMITAIRSVLCAPLRTARGLYGYLYVDNRSSTRIFREHHRELFTIFSAQATTALENAMAFAATERLNAQLEERVRQRTQELETSNQQLEHSLHTLKTTELRLAEAERDALEKEMSVASDIQRALLPEARVIQRPSLTLFGRMESATQCAGDAWTYVALPDGRTLVLIGDATGHGVGAGLVAVAAKAALTAVLEVSPGVGLDRLLSVLSDSIRGAGSAGIFMTACVCLVDPGAGRITLSGAAHDFPFLITHSEGLPIVQNIVTRGYRLGDIESEFEVSEHPWRPGDRLLLHTDGLVECANAADKEYGRRRLRKSIEALLRAPLVELVDGLFADLNAFLGERPKVDDVTIVALECPAGPIAHG